MYPDGVGVARSEISPGFLGSVGVASPTVISFGCDAIPFTNRSLVSSPSSEAQVTFCPKFTGP